MYDCNNSCNLELVEKIKYFVEIDLLLLTGRPRLFGTATNSDEVLARRVYLLRVAFPSGTPLCGDRRIGVHIVGKESMPSVS